MVGWEDVVVRTWRERMEAREQETGKTPWLLRQARAGEHAARADRHPWLTDFTLDGDTLTVGGQAVDLAGATARLETQGDLRRRVTAARAVTMGVFALAAKKKVDRRTVFLTIEGPRIAEVREYAGKKLDHLALRQFVADINSLAARQA